MALALPFPLLFAVTVALAAAAVSSSSSLSSSLSNPPDFEATPRSCSLKSSASSSSSGVGSLGLDLFAFDRGGGLDELALGAVVVEGLDFLGKAAAGPGEHGGGEKLGSTVVAEWRSAFRIAIVFCSVDRTMISQAKEGKNKRSQANLEVVNVALLVANAGDRLPGFLNLLKDFVLALLKIRSQRANNAILVACELVDETRQLPRYRQRVARTLDSLFLSSSSPYSDSSPTQHPTPQSAAHTPARAQSNPAPA